MLAAAADLPLSETPRVHAYDTIQIVVLNDLPHHGPVDVYIDGALRAAGTRWGDHSAPSTLGGSGDHVVALYSAVPGPPPNAASRADAPLTASQFIGQSAPGGFIHPTVPTIVRLIETGGDRWNVVDHDLVDDWTCDPGFGAITLQLAADVLVTDGYSGGSSTYGFHTSSRKTIEGQTRHLILQGAQASVDDFEPFAFGTFDAGVLTYREGIVQLYLAFGDEGTYRVMKTEINCATGRIGPIGEVPRNPTYPSSRFVPVTPIRLFDTRTPAAPFGPVRDKSVLDIQVTGRAGLPSSGITAVVLNVTAARTTGPGHVTVWPKGAPQPPTSNLNIRHAGQTIANLVTVPVGEGGKISMYALRQTDLLADVAGYFTAADSATAGRFVPLAPSRVFDTRVAPAPVGAIPARGTLNVQMTGTGQIPHDGVAAVVLNLTAIGVGGAGHITAFPGGGVRPDASNVNVAGPNDVAPNLAIVPVGADGSIDFYAHEATHLLADVFGYFTDGTAASSSDGLFVPTAPMRATDTRPTPANFYLDRFIDGGEQLQVDIGQVGDVPGLGSSAVLVNVTVTRTVAAGHLTAWPSHLPLPNASNVNWSGPNVSRPNAAIIPLGLADDQVGSSNPGGDITLSPYSGTHAIVDIFGYFTGTPT